MIYVYGRRIVSHSDSIVGIYPNLSSGGAHRNNIHDSSQREAETNLSTVSSHNIKTIQEKQENVEHEANAHFTFGCYRFDDLGKKQITLIDFYESTLWLLFLFRCIPTLNLRVSPGIVFNKLLSIARAVEISDFSWSCSMLCAGAKPSASFHASRVVNKPQK